MPHSPEQIPVPIFLLRKEKKDLTNHYFKTYSPVTTASYKPLSILNTLHRDRLLDLGTKRPVLCLGDGTGGYTLLMGRIFLQNKLFYNSLFEIEKLSSVGLDLFLPASLALSPSVYNRVDHMELTTEGCSDILSFLLL
uniref:Mononegavirus-type SAM-dependent 2'-O-MTase domain-containing protein n=1 Tax=Cacopsylla melanoneura TaxID=428564 RepID=A0A8D8SW28_9HEMI